MTPEERAEERYRNFGVPRTLYNTGILWGYGVCIREQVEPLEAENTKLRALVQRLVDALGHIEVPPNLLTDKVKAAVLAIDAANEQGFVPTNTTEG